MLDFSKALTYDEESRLSRTEYTFPGRSLVYQATYGDIDRLESFALSSAWEKTLQYDYMQRLTSSALKNAVGNVISQTTYGFLSPEAGKTTTMVSYESNSAADETLRYTYDSYGRVTQVLKNNEVINRYSYHPTYGFLVREDNAAANETYLYTYDEMGNMLEKQTYVLSFASTPEWILDWETFSYPSSDLGKLYNSTFGYDSLGNLTFDMEKCWSYTWDGRQLVDITADGGLPRFTFAYDSNGIRTQKGVAQSWDEWIYHDYTLDGTTILKETIYNEAYGMVSDSRDIYYYYDENGSPVGLNWNGEDYYYYKNIFGDVLGIMDSAGSMVVRYTYDAWGNPISTTGAMASTLGKDNPFRYRGYYYDAETELYYLNARYYNPEWSRFISIDPVLDTSSAVGCNMYVYCGSDPVNRVDPAGESWWDFISVVATVVVAAAVTVAVIAAAPAAICAGTAMLASAGVSAGAASTIATAAVAVVGANTAISAADSTYYALTGESPILEHVFDGDVSEYRAYHQVSSIFTAWLGELTSTGNQLGVCFVAGTLVLTENGAIPIEEVTTGMWVYSHDPETGETALKPVVQTFVNETSRLVHITVAGQEIITTPEHPFWVPNKGWTEAIYLRAGDVLQTVNGEYVVVEFVQHELLETPITVYNFEVEGFHTYFVGKNVVLVHNTCKGNSSSRGVGGKGWVGDKTWRENVSTVGKGGTITSLNGGVPTKAQAIQLINQSGGVALRTEAGHDFPNPHNFLHINYVTSTGIKGTIKIFE